MTTRDQLTHERLKALLAMIREGDTPAGELPSQEYLELLEKGASDLRDADKVASAARNGVDPQTIRDELQGGP